MIRYEDDCVGCPQGCIACGRRHTPHLYCDHCGEEAEELYKWGADGEDHLCEYCLLNKFSKVDPYGENYGK